MGGVFGLGMPVQCEEVEVALGRRNNHSRGSTSVRKYNLPRQAQKFQ